MNSTRRHAAVLLFIAFAAAVPYLNALRNGFVWDDRPLILEDYQIRSAQFLPDIFSRDFFSHSDDDLKYGYYRPLVTLSYMADYALWGRNPVGFHATNILLHALCAMLVYPLVLGLVRCRPRTAALAALLFAVHPIHTESVTWIAGRTDVISTLFVLLALLAHIRGGRAARWVLVPLLVAAALLAKEMALVVPALLFVIEFFARRSGFKASVVRSLPAAAVVLLYMIWRSVIAEVAYNPAGVQMPGLFLLSVLKTFWVYAWKLVWPVDLCAYIQNPHVLSMFSAPAMVGLALTAVLGVVAWRMWTSRSPLLAPTLALVLCFVPLSNLIRISGPPDMGFPMSERFLYLPSAFFCAILAWLLAETTRWRPAGLVVGACLVAFWGGRTVLRNRDWRDDGTFFKVCIRQAPTSALLRAQLGLYYAREGQHDEAAAHLKDALRISQEQTGLESAALLNNLAAIYRMAGRYNEALPIFTRLAEGGSHRAVVELNLGQCYLGLRRYPEARASLFRALHLRPRYVDAMAAMGFLETEEGRFEEAAGQYRAAIALIPDSAELRVGLGVALKQSGRLDEAIEAFASAVALDPQMAPAHGNLGAAYAMLGNFDAARVHLERAVAINPRLWDAQNALGMVYAKQGDRAAARAKFEEILAANPINADAMLNEGVLDYEAGDLVAARERFEAAAKAAPSDIRPSSYLQQLDRPK